jgi:NAD(P)-dependent dehydrogenase (short-subunit alcohol dehydrogenase family)
VAVEQGDMTKQQLVVVSGGSGALGAALVAHLVRAGRRVAVLDRAVPASETDVSISRYTLDAASLEEWRATLARIEHDDGPVDGAALVAGGWRGGAPLYDPASADHWRAMLDSNLETARAALATLLPRMIERRRGSIVLIGSRAAERPWESAGAAAYAAAKSAAVALVQAAAAEVRESGVRINAVLPSTLDTEANRRAMPNADPERWVSTESLSGVIEFLLSDAARDISGAAIPVYGRA